MIYDTWCAAACNYSRSDRSSTQTTPLHLHVTTSTPGLYVTTSTPSGDHLYTWPSRDHLRVPSPFCLQSLGAGGAGGGGGYLVKMGCISGIGRLVLIIVNTLSCVSTSSIHRCNLCHITHYTHQIIVCNAIYTCILLHSKRTRHLQTFSTTLTNVFCLNTSVDVFDGHKLVAGAVCVISLLNDFCRVSLVISL